MTTGLLIWYLATSILMAAILFKPVKKFIFVQKVRKAEGKLKRELSEEERQELELVSNMTTLTGAGVKVASPRGFEPLLPP